MRVSFLFIWLIFFSFIFSACSQPEDKVIRELIFQMKKEAEALDFDAFMEHISKHYKDDSGNTYLIIYQLIKNNTKELDALSAEVSVLGVSVRDKKAEAQIKLMVQARKRGEIYYLLGKEDLPEFPRLFFAKEGFSWKLVKVSGIKGESQAGGWWQDF